MISIQNPLARSTDTITKSLTKMVAKLRSHAESSTTRGREIRSKVIELRTEAFRHETEARRANTTADKIEALLG